VSGKPDAGAAFGGAFAQLNTVLSFSAQMNRNLTSRSLRQKIALRRGTAVGIFPGKRAIVALRSGQRTWLVLGAAPYCENLKALVSRCVHLI
jgi:hypothetical protein